MLDKIHFVFSYGSWAKWYLQKKWTSSPQDSNQSNIYAKLKKYHIYCSGSLEDRLDSASLFNNL